MSHFYTEVHVYQTVNYKCDQFFCSANHPLYQLRASPSVILATA